MNVETARSMLINDPGFWHQRAEEARRLAERMKEMAKQTMLMVAKVCDSFAIGAAMCSIYEVALSPVTTERELMLRENRLLESANPLMRFQGYPLHH
jgi:adenylylsulfate kinase-like enzyme